MFHPNRRYANPHAFRALTAGLSFDQVANMLHRHPRTIRDWHFERRPIPYWVVELLEMRAYMHMEMLRQMGIRPVPSLKVCSQPLAGPTRAQRAAATG